MEVDYLELKKVPGSLGNLRDMWAVLLSTEKEEVIDMLADNNEEMNKVVQKLKYVSADDITRFAYDQKMKAEMDYYSDIATFKEEGLKEGRELGEREGIKKGADTAKRDIALSLIHQGVPKATISIATQLTLDEIDQLIVDEQA